ncbi:MAG TPA: hypothetical protein PLF81_08380 [Candidatus Anammoximicrobium sp.]|nr:hypothetical protein [Candidatus Anammoximicrobium sp.]
MWERRFGSAMLTIWMALGWIGAADGAEVPTASTVTAGEAVNRLRGAKIISIQDVDKINAIDQEGMKGVWGNSPLNEYDRDYPHRLKEFLGLELIIVRSGELLEEMANVEEEAIEDLADRWIREATEMKNVTRSDVLRSARLYWGFKSLLKKYSAVAITYESATLTLSEKKVLAWTPLAILELSKEHIPCCCQSHVDCLVTQLIGSTLTGGRPGFVGDVLNDWAFKPAGERPQNVIVVGHCGAPINPHGNDRIPYLIRDHIHSDKWNVPGAVAEATTVTWPADEPATVVKFDVFRKKVSVYTGTVLDGNRLYVDFPNCICRNKLVVQIDRPDDCYLLPSSPKEGSFRSWWGSWGCHQVAFYGNLRESFQKFAAETGFQLVEGKQ